MYDTDPLSSQEYYVTSPFQVLGHVTEGYPLVPWQNASSDWPKTYNHLKLIPFQVSIGEQARLCST